MRTLTLCLILLYPLTMHISVAIGDPNPAIFLLLVGILIISTGLFRNQRYLAGVYCLFGAMGLYFVAYYSFSDHFTILYIPPLVVSLYLAWLFGRSLAPGQVALISHMAAALHGQLTPPLVQYTRRVTMVWTGYFVVFGFSVFYTGFINPGSNGSFYVNLFNYAVITLLVVGEYLIRIYRFKELDHPGFIDFIRLLNKTRWYMPSHNR